MSLQLPGLSCRMNFSVVRWCCPSLRFSEQLALQFKYFLEPQVVDNSSYTDYTTPNKSLIVSINCAIIIGTSQRCLPVPILQTARSSLHWLVKKSQPRKFRGLWKSSVVVGCEISNLSILLQRSDWALWLAAKFQPPEFCKVSQRSAVVGRKLSNLPNFAASRDGALWLVENSPTSSIYYGTRRNNSKTFSGIFCSDRGISQ